MKIYTKTGDNGTTGLIGGTRVSKGDDVITLVGELDELNCHLGALRAHLDGHETDTLLARIQGRLFEVGAEVASTPGGRHGVTATLGSVVPDLEASIDRLESNLEPLRQFILPGGCHAGAAAHLARSVCRRAERSFVRFSNRLPVRTDILVFLNRLSDWLFVLARSTNASSGVPETPWSKEEA